MKNLFKITLSVILLTGINLSIAQAQLYEVTVTNLTRGQIFSPVFAVTHKSTQQLFSTGEQVSPQLAALAQDANTEPLTDLLSDSPSIFQIKQGTGVILPGKSETLIIESNRRSRFISLASMLVSTNDAFMAVNRVRLPFRASVLTVPAYDAGAEANNENCAYIPGPPCGNANAEPQEDAEGFVHIHAGIHGIGDLDAAQFDWQNPVAKILIRRIKKRNHY